MNLLITSVSRKVWLVQAFQRAAQIYSGRVFASDLDPLAVGLYFADAAVPLPPLTDDSFLSECLTLCQRFEIGLIIPTRDEDVAWFSRHARIFLESGVRVMVAPERVVEICQDKRAFLSFCQSGGFSVPHIYTTYSDDTQFPLFARPRFGKGGLGAGPIDRDVAKRLFSEEKAEWIVQDIINADEYTLDVFMDFSGNILSVIPRQRLRVQSGEVVVSKTVEAALLIDEASRLSSALGLVGHNTLQCFWDGETVLWIEVNPRYGGGAALGFEAGADTPGMLLGLLNGKEIIPCIDKYKRGLCLFRYSSDIYMDESEAMPWI